MLTGDSIFQSFIRFNRYFVLVRWLSRILSFLWFGAFAAAGETSLAVLTDIPSGWSQRGQTIFLAYLTMFIFLSAILLSKVVYRLVEVFMYGVALVAVTSLLMASSPP